jgi:hypothetical protein
MPETGRGQARLSIPGIDRIDISNWHARLDCLPRLSRSAPSGLFAKGVKHARLDCPRSARAIRHAPAAAGD